MTCEANGYGFKGRRPAGRSIVEERGHNGKLTVWAQDLRAETHYGVFMLFKDGERYAGIGMGALPVDEKGKGEVRREFEQDELDGFNLSDIVAVAVLAKDATGTVSPLCGYKDQIVSWRHKFYEYTQTIVAFKYEDEPLQAEVRPAEACLPQEPPVAEAIPQADEAGSGPDTTQLDGDSPAVTQTDEDNLDASPMEESPSFSEEHLEVPPIQQEEPLTPTPENEDTSPPEYATEDGPGEDTTFYDPTPIRQFTTQTVSQKSEIAKSFRVALDQLHADTVLRSAPPSQHTQHDNLDAIFSSKEPAIPFQRQSRKTKWVRFNLSDQVPPPINKPHLFEEPFILTALEEHGHLILGMTADPGPRRYIIGVPGNPNQDSRQKARRLGFTQFKHCDDTRPNGKGEPGYWLMFITA